MCFSRQVEPTAAQKAVTAPFQGRGVVQINQQHEITQAERYFRKIFHTVNDILQYYVFGDLTLPFFSEKSNT